MRIWLGVVLAASLLGCRVQGHARVTMVDSEPPPPQEETMTEENPGHLWVHGHWAYLDNRWAWQAGYWEAERPSYVWIEGRWEQQGQRWAWVEGHWEAAGGT